MDRDDYFAAEQNAKLIKDTEQYYRTMYRGGVSSWNLRDRHMVRTLDALRDHLGHDGLRAKIAVWAHNSHLGDARATEMGQRGELNVGQLVREQYGPKASLIGQTTSVGTVTAASDWDEPVELKRVRPALAGSCERLFHETSIPRFFLPLGGEPVRTALKQPLLERAIGVIYRPDTERGSHYFYASLPFQSMASCISITQLRCVRSRLPRSGVGRTCRRLIQRGVMVVPSIGSIEETRSTTVAL